MTAMEMASVVADEPEIVLPVCATEDEIRVFTGWHRHATVTRMGSTIAPARTPKGDSLIGPLHPGFYQLGLRREEILFRLSTDNVNSVEIAEAETKTVEVGVDVVDAADEVVDPATAELMAFEVCYRNDDWVQPPFEDGYDPAASYYGTQEITAEQAREMYARRIYRAYGGVEGQTAYVWSLISGHPRMPPDCIRANGDVYVLVSYEPVEILQDNSSTQVRVRSTPAGLYALGVPRPVGGWSPLGRPAEEVTVFVDETDAVVLVCRVGGCQEPEPPNPVP